MGHRPDAGLQLCVVGLVIDRLAVPRPDRIRRAFGDLPTSDHHPLAGPVRRNDPQFPPAVNAISRPSGDHLGWSAAVFVICRGYPQGAPRRAPRDEASGVALEPTPSDESKTMRCCRVPRQSAAPPPGPPPRPRWSCRPPKRRLRPAECCHEWCEGDFLAVGRPVATNSWFGPRSAVRAFRRPAGPSRCRRCRCGPNRTRASCRPRTPQASRSSRIRTSPAPRRAPRRFRPSGVATDWVSACCVYARYASRRPSTESEMPWAFNPEVNPFRLAFRLPPAAAQSLTEHITAATAARNEQQRLGRPASTQDWHRASRRWSDGCVFPRSRGSHTRMVLVDTLPRLSSPNVK